MVLTITTCCSNREHMPGGGRGAQGVPQGVPQGVSHMPSIPFADPAVASSASSAQQAGRPFQSAEIMSSAPISMDNVFTSSQVLFASCIAWTSGSFLLVLKPSPMLSEAGFQDISDRSGWQEQFAACWAVFERAQHDASRHCPGIELALHQVLTSLGIPLHIFAPLWRCLVGCCSSTFSDCWLCGSTY